MKLLKELVEHDENFHGLVAVNSLDSRSKAVNKTVKGAGRTRREFPWVSSCQFI